jgi:thymidylate synthase (FAD)
MIDLQFMHCMGDDDLVVDAARVSFDRQADSFGPNQNESLINFLAREGHTAPFSHPHVTFRCTAPIFVARQLAKSQVGGTWNEVSRRYVKTSPDYWKPTILRAGADDIKQGSKPDAHRRSKEFLEDYNELCIDAVALYNKMIARMPRASTRSFAPKHFN